MTARPTMTGACRNCRQPVEGFVAGGHDVCGVYCAVMLNVPIEGLSDAEICKHFVDELTAALDVRDDDETACLQRGLASLLYWLSEADGRVAQRQLATGLLRFLEGSRATPQ